ncbi:hypothetical protein TARUN_1074 [Trichoderma arundinaceum]|uniref:Xylanolytic transcriptional activator regulatory domain-containing protein n=1 Tax=Trichoderma arundinaceum TaxID=490622 RepID=A0A395NYF0_TRIAR|nr:hypothetical protein TARUN_1074 [Trichoderma arundinaceum]
MVSRRQKRKAGGSPEDEPSTHKTARNRAPTRKPKPKVESGAGTSGTVCHHCGQTCNGTQPTCLRYTRNTLPSLHYDQSAMTSASGKSYVSWGESSACVLGKIQAHQLEPAAFGSNDNSKNNDNNGRAFSSDKLTGTSVGAGERPADLNACLAYPFGNSFNAVLNSMGSNPSMSQSARRDFQATMDSPAAMNRRATMSTSAVIGPQASMNTSAAISTPAAMKSGASTSPSALINSQTLVSTPTTRSKPLSRNTPVAMKIPSFADNLEVMSPITNPQAMNNPAAMVPQAATNTPTTRNTPAAINTTASKVIPSITKNIAIMNTPTTMSTPAARRPPAARDTPTAKRPPADANTLADVNVPVDSSPSTTGDALVSINNPEAMNLPSTRSTRATTKPRASRKTPASRNIPAETNTPAEIGPSTAKNTLADVNAPTDRNPSTTGDTRSTKSTRAPRKPPASKKSSADVNPPETLAFEVTNPPATTKLPAVTSPPQHKNPPTNVNPRGTVGPAPPRELLPIAPSLPNTMKGRPRAANYSDKELLNQKSYSYIDSAPRSGSDRPLISLDCETKEALSRMKAIIMKDCTDPLFLMPPRELSIHLVNEYLADVYYMFPFFDRRAFRDALDNLYREEGFKPLPARLGLGCPDEADPTSPLFQCALFMMLSHAAHSLHMELEDKLFVSRAFWKCAKWFITPALLDTCSLATVQTFLMLAVVLNSSCSPGKARIPTELACRIARSLGIRDGNDEVLEDDEGTARLKKVRARTWYVCVLMSVFSQSPRSSTFAFASDITQTLQSAPLSKGVDIEFFEACTVHFENLEAIMVDVRKLQELNFQPFSGDDDDGCDNYVLMAPKLRKKIDEFSRKLPDDLQWEAWGLPSYEFAVDGPRSQKRVSNASYLYMRALIFHPIFMQEDGGGAKTHKADSGVNILERTLYCATLCVQSAMHLIQGIHSSFKAEVQGDKEWWGNPYRLVLIMAQTFPLLWCRVNKPAVANAWAICQQMVAQDASQNPFRHTALVYLWNLNASIPNVPGMENDYSLLRAQWPESTDGIFPERSAPANMNPAVPSLVTAGSSTAPVPMPFGPCPVPLMSTPDLSNPGFPGLSWDSNAIPCQGSPYMTSPDTPPLYTAPPHTPSLYTALPDVTAPLHTPSLYIASPHIAPSCIAPPYTVAPYTSPCTAFLDMTASPNTFFDMTASPNTFLDMTASPNTFLDMTASPNTFLDMATVTGYPYTGSFYPDMTHYPATSGSNSMFNPPSSTSITAAAEPLSNINLPVSLDGIDDFGVVATGHGKESNDELDTEMDAFIFWDGSGGK